jgi:hypothetical protein
MAMAMVKLQTRVSICIGLGDDGPVEMGHMSQIKHRKVPTNRICCGRAQLGEVSALGKCILCGFFDVGLMFFYSTNSHCFATNTRARWCEDRKL